MGLTYNFLANNIEILIVVLILILKTLLFQFILSIIRRIFKFKPKIYFVKNLRTDFIWMTPTITVSALISLLDSGLVNFK